jgi:hypothetical protein
MMVGDSIIESGGISVVDKKALSARGWPKAGEVREYIVYRNGESIELQLTFAKVRTIDIPKKIIPFIVGLFFVILGMYSYFRLRTGISVIYAFFTLLFAYNFLLGPHLVDDVSSRIVDIFINSVRVFCLPPLVQFLLKYPPENKFIKKNSNLIWLYSPAILIIILGGISVLLLPDEEGVFNQLAGILTIVYTLIYLVWSVLILIRKFVKANSEKRKILGLNLMIWGVSIALIPLIIIFIISMITQNPNIAGGNYGLLILIAIPVFFTLALFKQHKYLTNKAPDDT